MTSIKKGAQSNDNSRDVSVSGNHEHKRSNEDIRGISRSNDAGLSPSHDAGGSIECSVEEAEELQVIEELRSISQILEVSSGPLPPPDLLAKYPKPVQDKIIGWQDAAVKAQFTDASLRDDKIAESVVRKNKEVPRLSFVIDCILILGTLIAFVITNNPNVFWSYTILGASIIGNVAININANKSTNRSERDTEK